MQLLILQNDDIVWTCSETNSFIYNLDYKIAKDFVNIWEFASHIKSKYKVIALYNI